MATATKLRSPRQRLRSAVIRFLNEERPGWRQRDYIIYTHANVHPYLSGVTYAATAAIEQAGQPWAHDFDEWLERKWLDEGYDPLQGDIDVLGDYEVGLLVWIHP